MGTKLTDLLKHKYWGRAIIPALDEQGNETMIYFISGRSPSSKARILVIDDKTNTIFTQSTDDAVLKNGNPALLLYPAMTYINEAIIATNGAQTSLIYSTIRNMETHASVPDYLFRGKSKTSFELLPQQILEHAFENPSYMHDQKGNWIDITEHEPDAPIFTPRISVVLRHGNVAVYTAYKDISDDSKNFMIESADLCKNKKNGRFVPTYCGEDHVLPTIGPYKNVIIPKGNIETIAKEIFDSMQGENENGKFRVAVAVMQKTTDGVRSYVVNATDRK